jgi:NAD(P)-dependent dehydrogenase (short-subunit alcohol dehydrogenase family)
MTIMGGLFSSSSAGLEEWLDDRAVWITGASSGLGRALAIEAARRGARVALSARDVGKLEEVKRECLAAAPASAASGGVVMLVRPLDMGRYDGPEFAAAAAEVAKALGGLDVLISNAGVSTRSSARETALGVDVAVMGTNFFGPVALTKAALPYLRQVGLRR